MHSVAGNALQNLYEKVACTHSSEINPIGKNYSFKTCCTTRKGSPLIKHKLHFNGSYPGCMFSFVRGDAHIDPKRVMLYRNH